VVHDHLTATELKPGFIFDGERIRLINPQRGIFKPRQMRVLLSIKGGKVWYDDQREAHRRIVEGDVAFDPLLNFRPEVRCRFKPVGLPQLGFHLSGAR
jgi:hypothetical protein